MKKTYVRPDVKIIGLSMEQAVCASCGVSATFAENACAVEIPGLGSVFLDTSNCMFTNDIDVCYHTPTANSNVFSS